jgi:CheY-like chemotaxis protein
MAELLADRLEGAEEREMLGVIREPGRALMTILNDILDFSKMEAGRLDLETAPVSLPEIGRRVEAVHALKAEEKGLGFSVIVGPEASAPRLGDAHRIQQILHNLIGNAIKFTDRGWVSVAIDATGPDVAIHVRDEGCGMTAEQAARVFEEFSQADSSTPRRFGGTGLGLAIVKGLVDAMGGAVALETAPDEGTEIRVTLPLPLAAADVAPQRPTGATALPAGLRVLAADDNEINRIVLSRFLETLDISATVVEGGREAIAAGAAGGFDAILLDISMPGIDGVEALAGIRAGEAARGAPPTPALAVTANAMAHQIEAYRAAGFDGHVAKPIRRDDLIAALAMATAAPGR